MGIGALSDSGKPPLRAVSRSGTPEACHGVTVMTQRLRVPAS